MNCIHLYSNAITQYIFEYFVEKIHKCQVPRVTDIKMSHEFFCICPGVDSSPIQSKSALASNKIRGHCVNTHFKS